MNKHGGYLGDNKKEIIDFSVNINPLGVPTKLMESLVGELPMLISYPEIDGESAKISLANYLDKDKEQVILGNGATELIYLFARSIKASKVLLISPTFTEYERAFKISGSEIHHFITREEDCFSINMEDLLEKINKIQADLVVLCNPNNPTGRFYQPDQLMPLLEKLKKEKRHVFIDESFIDFTDKSSAINFIEEYPIFILRSMTKIYAIPGLRLGYGIGNKELIKLLHSKKEPWTINSLGLKAVDILLEDKEYLKKTMDWYKSEKEFLFDRLSEMETLEVFPSETNFFLCKLKKITGQELKERLLEEGIYIRTCTDFQGLNEQFVRFAVRTRDENKRLIKTLCKLNY